MKPRSHGEDPNGLFVLSAAIRREERKEDAREGGRL